MFAPHRIFPTRMLQTTCRRWFCAAGRSSPTPRNRPWPARRPTARHPTPLADALLNLPTTLIHGDLATVNVAFEPDRVTLIDWGMPAAAPAAVDMARLLAGCASVIDATREQVIDDFRELAGSAHDETAMRLALLTSAGLAGLEQGTRRRRPSRTGDQGPGARRLRLVAQPGRHRLDAGYWSCDAYLRSRDKSTPSRASVATKLLIERDSLRSDLLVRRRAVCCEPFAQFRRVQVHEASRAGLATGAVPAARRQEHYGLASAARRSAANVVAGLRTRAGSARDEQFAERNNRS